MGACRSSPPNQPEEEEKLVNVSKPAKDEETKATAGSDQGITEPSFWHPGSDAVPHDTHEAVGPSVEWMNYMLRVMWPYMRQAIITKAGDKFNDAMGNELSKHPEIKLTELKLNFDPGTRCPVIKHLLCYQRTQQERTGVQIDTDFTFEPDEQFTMQMTIRGKAGLVPIKAEGVGISTMDVSGTMSVLLSPLLPVDPCFGTGQAFFLDTPKMNIRMKGMKALGPVGNLLTKVIEGVVRNILQDGYILPHRFLHRVRKDLALDTLVNMKSPPPLGVLLIHVLEGKNLKTADLSITGRKSSDPFVEVKIGHGKGRTSTVEDTVHPSWKRDKPIAMFIYNVAQLVRITVYDDDVMGSEVLGMLIGYNVYLFCQETFNKPEGAWFDLYDTSEDEKGTKAGQLRIRAEYYDVADLKPAHHEVPAIDKKIKTTPPPYVLTVKLLGLEAEDRGDLRGTRAVVELKHPKASDDDVHDDEKEAHNATRLMTSLSAAMGSFESTRKTVSAAMESLQSKVKHATGLGFGHWEDGIPKVRKSGKAMLWGTQVNLQDSEHRPIPPMAIRAMEKLHMREGWPIAKIANMFGLDPSVVRLAVEMRGNFEVVFHEALHFLQPAENPFHGHVKVSVTAPSHNQVRGADDHGYIGDATFDLAELAQTADHKWCQRHRVMLARPKVVSTVSGLAGKMPAMMFSKSPELAVEEKGSDPVNQLVINDQATKDSYSRGGSVGEQQEGDLEQSGILLELVLEVRQLTYGECEKDEGQTLRAKDHIVNATMSAGVHILPDE